MEGVGVQGLLSSILLVLAIPSRESLLALPSSEMVKLAVSISSSIVLLCSDESPDTLVPAWKDTESESVSTVRQLQAVEVEVAADSATLITL
jgi:hypothetical protein